MTVVGFFVRHFTERGTEVAIFDYAHYNETLLGNTSIILCFTPETQRSIGFPETRASYSKFAARFRVVEIKTIAEAAHCGLDVFYTLTHGCYEDIYQFSNRTLWGPCKTIKHCVFDTRSPQADAHISISDQLNVKFGTSIPVVPHMISVDPSAETLRTELGIPVDALVFGRHGGYDTFDVSHARDAVKALAGERFYFIFLNTPSFIDHPNVKFLPMTTDPVRKRQFINTCDACLHGRTDGETFGLAVGEFAVCMKPIFTWAHGVDNAHLMILGDKAIQYSSTADLVDALRSFRPSDHDMSGNGYLQYTPEAVIPRLVSFY